MSRCPISVADFMRKNAAALAPPVGGKAVWTDTSDFLTVILGGNDRTDWHVNPTEEFFFQLEGDMILKVRENDATKDVPIKAGQIFVLPRNVPHSPQRPAGTRGIVVERFRPPGTVDKVQWYCQQCDGLLFSVEGEIQANRLVEFINEATAGYIADREKHACHRCGHMNPAR